MTARWSSEKPAPEPNGSKAVVIASTKCFKGKTSASRSTHSGMSAPTVNIPEMNARSTMMPLVTDSTTVLDRSSATAASPSDAKHATPTTRVTITAAAVRPSSWTS